MSISSPPRWWTTISIPPTANCWSCRRKADCASAPNLASSTCEPKEIAHHPARSGLPGRGAGRPGARLRLRELRPEIRPAGPRPDRRQLPGQSARLQDPGRRLRGPRDAHHRVIVKWCGQFHETSIDHSPLDVVAWHGNYAPYKYDLRDLFAGRRDPVRPSRSVDLHGPDRAVGRSRHGQHRFRAVPRALDGGRTFLPPAVVPQEHHVAN